MFPVSINKCLLGVVYSAHRPCPLRAEAKMQRVGKKNEQSGRSAPGSLTGAEHCHSFFAVV